MVGRSKNSVSLSIKRSIWSLKKVRVRRKKYRKRNEKSVNEKWLNPFDVDPDDAEHDAILRQIDNELKESADVEGDDHNEIFKSLRHYTKLTRRIAGDIVENKYFENFMILSIIGNSITLGISTLSYVKDNEERKELFEMMDFIFLLLFTFEYGLHFIHQLFRVLLDNGLVFDLIVIILSWLYQSVTILRSFKITRVFRIFRSLTLLNRLVLLKGLMIALISTLPRLKTVIILLLLVLYIFSVLFTQLYRNNSNIFGVTCTEGMQYSNYSERDEIIDEIDISTINCTEAKLSEDYFGNFTDTLFTLFQIMTMDNFMDVAWELFNAYKWSWVPFISYMFFSSFVFLNLFLAVLCDAVEDLRRHNMEKVTVVENIDEDKYLDEQIACLTEEVQSLVELHKCTCEAVDNLQNDMMSHISIVNGCEELFIDDTEINSGDGFLTVQSVVRGNFEAQAGHNPQCIIG